MSGGLVGFDSSDSSNSRGSSSNGGSPWNWSGFGVMRTAGDDEGGGRVLNIGPYVQAVSPAILLAANYGRQVINAFEGPIYRVTLPVQMTVYRFFGGTSPNARGNWLTNERTMDLIRSLDINVSQVLALPPGATAENLAKWVIPANTEVLMGGIRGGAAWAIQIFVRNPGVLQAPK